MFRVPVLSLSWQMFALLLTIIRKRRTNKAKTVCVRFFFCVFVCLNRTQAIHILNQEMRCTDFML